MSPRAFLACLLVGVSLSADLTRVERSSGPEVVEAVVNIIRESCLFADDKRFLRRLAYVESEDGMLPKTYRAGYNGGIWQVDEAAFKRTQNQHSLSAQYHIIRSRIGINWPLVRWSDLRKPLYSGVAAALYTLLEGHGSNAITWKVEDQGTFWSAHFHSGRPATNFTFLANLLDLGCHVNQRLDLVFVVDSSSSLSQDDFNRALYFVDQVASGFRISTTDTQVALITYSTSVMVEFYLNTYRSQSALSNAILGAQYHTGSTQTAKAIDKAVNDVFSSSRGARSGVVKVLVVITDGDSDDPINTRHAAEHAQANSIVVFSVGVGSKIHINELNTVATNPDCTHTYQVKSYEEIRFMTEEIQHATCIAPLFINKTYSCEISRCPPIAVIMPPGGMTIETNISCGGMTVYSAFSNPYPSKAQYENMGTSSNTHIYQQFYNTTGGQTLYMNLKDNQGPMRNGSTGCIATVTPYHGDKTDKTVHVICKQNNVEIPCKPSYFNCTDTQSFASYCTRENLLKCKYRFPHPTDPSKFIMCDKAGKDYVVSCPAGQVFQADCSTCLGAGDVSTANCHTPLNSCDNNTNNPCTAANILARKFYFTYPGDIHKYIQCDIWGHPWVRNCRQGMEWKQSEETCVKNNTDPLCPYHPASGPRLHPHPCDPHKYIQCDNFGESFEMNCQPNYLFLPGSLTCAPIGFPGTETLVYTCNGAHHTYVTGTAPPAFTGTARQYTLGTGTPSAGYALSHNQYDPPCTKANIDAGHLYFPSSLDQHHYIQCDLTGHQYLQRCSSAGQDWFNPLSSTCVDGPVISGFG